MSSEHRGGDVVQFPGGGTLARREFVRRAMLLGIAPSALGALLAACGESSQGPPAETAPATQASAQPASSVASAATTAPATTAAAAESTAATATAAGTTTAAAPATLIPGPPWEGGVKGGSMTVSYADQTVTYDPPVAYDQGGYYGLQNFYRGLMLYGDDPLTPQLDMAESLDISDDGLVYEFKLKPGIQFHHGREATAEDFKYTLERSSSKELASWAGPFLANVAGYDAFQDGTAPGLSGVEAVDATTLRITLSAPDVTLLGALAIGPYFVVPQDEVERLGARFATNPVGTGPYRLTSFDEASSTYVAERFDDYYYSELPYPDTLNWEWGIERQLQFLRVQRGESDSVGAGLPAATIASVANDPKLSATFKAWDNFYPLWIEFNVTRPPFDDVRVRQAFNYAVDQQRLTPLAINPTGHFFPPGIPGYDDALQIYGHDPERANALLDQAGFDRSRVIELPIFNQTDEGQQLIAQDLEQVGVKVKLVNVPSSFSDLGLKLQDQFDLWSKSWGMGRPDPSELVLSLVGTKAPANYGGYSNPDIDRLGKEGLSETDPGKRGDIYAEIERIMMEDAAFLFLGVNIWASFWSERLANYNWNGVYFEFWDRIWLAA
jgi:ABC-type transport system substrate-binding protein